MNDRDGNAEEDDAHFRALHRDLRSAQARLQQAHARHDALLDAVTTSEMRGGVAPIGLLADLNEAERVMGSVEDDVLDAECALIMVEVGCVGDKDPEEDQRF